MQRSRNEISILIKEIDEVVSRDSTLTTLKDMVDNVIRDCETRVVVSHTQSYKMEMATLVRDIISKSVVSAANAATKQIRKRRMEVKEEQKEEEVCRQRRL